MPYQRILDELLRSVGGRRGALLLDAEGEVVIQAGHARPRHRLIGAYQGIGAGHGAQDAGRARRQRAHPLHAVPLRRGQSSSCGRSKDGYYLVVSLPADGRVGGGHPPLGARPRRSSNQEL